MGQAPDRPNFFVTYYGEAVHLTADCHSIKGFGTEDHDVYLVSVDDPCCRGRHVCGTCERHFPSHAQLVQSALSRQGPQRTWKELEAEGARRPGPPGLPIRPGSAGGMWSSPAVTWSSSHNEQVCSRCFLRRPRHMFDGQAEVCRDCT